MLKLLRTFIIILIINFNHSFSTIYSTIFPVQKIILTDDRNNLNFLKHEKEEMMSIGYGLLFNDTLNISLIPMQLFNNIIKSFKTKSSHIVKIHPNKTEELFLYTDDYSDLLTFHFILENIGITIPFEHLFLFTGIHQIDDETQKMYSYRFKSVANQENIIIGRDLIEIMGIEFENERNLVITNKEFVSILND